MICLTLLTTCQNSNICPEVLLFADDFSIFCSNPESDFLTILLHSQAYAVVYLELTFSK